VARESEERRNWPLTVSLGTFLHQKRQDIELLVEMTMSCYHHVLVDVSSLFRCLMKLGLC
jgi:hypothetical protein